MSGSTIVIGGMSWLQSRSRTVSQGVANIDRQQSSQVQGLAVMQNKVNVTDISQMRGHRTQYGEQLALSSDEIAFLQPCAVLLTNFIMVHSESNAGLQEPKFAPAIVTSSLETVSKHLFVL